MRGLIVAVALVTLVEIGGCKGRKEGLKPAIATRVWQLTSSDPVEVQAAIDFLLSQDKRDVVPALMAHIDDLHPLHVQRVVVQDLRDAAAPVRRYRPKKFCDLLAALLHHVTGENFGYIYDGEEGGVTDADRLETIALWQKWWSENWRRY